MIKAEEFYEKIFNITSPFERQLKLWNSGQSGRFPLLLKALTSSGKTEAILAPFFSQFIDNHFHISPRTIYVLPNLFASK